MKYLATLTLLVLLSVSFNAVAHCDPRYYDPSTCRPYTRPVGLILPNNPYNTISRDPMDYTGGRDMVGINNRYYGGVHYHSANCGHGNNGGYYNNSGQTQQQYSRFRVYGNLGTVGGYGNGRGYGQTGGNIGFSYEAGKSRQR